MWDWPTTATPPDEKWRSKMRTVFAYSLAREHRDWTRDQIAREARRAVCPWGSGRPTDFRTFDGLSQTAAIQRRVSAEFHRRLRAAGIYVEGA